MGTHLLLKFGAKDHIEMLQKQGIIYCKHIKYFLELEDGKVRGDEFEAVVELKYMKEAVLQLKPAKEPNKEWKELKVQNTLLKKYDPNPLGNLFCMSALKVSPSNEPLLYKIDDRFKAFGTHFIIIEQQEIFLERLRNELDRLKLNYTHNLVEYLDLHRYTGERSLFQKDMSYAYQEEFRIFLDTQNMEPFQFSIGNIEDISTVYDLSKVMSFWIRKP